MNMKIKTVEYVKNLDADQVVALLAAIGDHLDTFGDDSDDGMNTAYEHIHSAMAAIKKHIEEQRQRPRCDCLECRESRHERYSDALDRMFGNPVKQLEAL